METVYIVDDDADVRRAYVKALAAPPYSFEVRAFGSAHQAERALATGPSPDGLRVPTRYDV